MGPNFVLDKGFLATTAISQFRCVRQTAVDAVAVANTAGQRALGICQETVDTADANKRVVDIRIMGISRATVATGATIALLDPLRVDANGDLTTLAAVTANQRVVGLALVAVTSAAAGSQIDVLLTPGVTTST